MKRLQRKQYMVVKKKLQKMKNELISFHCVSCTELLALCVVVVVSQHRCSITAKELGRSRAGARPKHKKGRPWPCSVNAALRPFRLHEELMYLRKK